MNHVVKKQQGFTLVELVLAMGFVGALLLTIAITVLQIGTIYNQGTTLREVNQAARDISEDLRRNVSRTSAIDPSIDYVLTPSASDPAGGRLCLGSYSYIWNYAKAIASDDINLTKYGTPSDSVPILVKVPDSAKIYCAIDGGGVQFKNIRGVDIPEVQELLKTGDHSLGIHQFGFITPIPDSASNTAIKQSLYSLQFTIGTNDVKALNDTQTACLEADKPNAEPKYCNVKQFNLVVRAGK